MLLHNITSLTTISPIFGKGLTYLDPNVAIFNYLFFSPVCHEYLNFQHTEYSYLANVNGSKGLKLLVK